MERDISVPSRVLEHLVRPKKSKSDSRARASEGRGSGSGTPPLPSQQEFRFTLTTWTVPLRSVNRPIFKGLPLHPTDPS